MSKEIAVDIFQAICQQNGYGDCANLPPKCLMEFLERYNETVEWVEDKSPAAYNSMSLPELAAELKRLRTALDKAKAYSTELQKKHDYLAIDVIPEAMGDVTSMNITGVGRLQLRTDIRCNTLAEHKENLEKWLVDNGHGSMLSTAVNSSTLKAFIKEQMKENKPYPVDFIKVHPYSQATIVKA